MADGFGERLVERVREVGPLCVGIDPSRRLVEAWGRSDTIDGLEFVARTTLESVADIAGAVKPQVAFFERFGAAGYAVLERLIRDARDADVLVVADAKRADIGSSNEGYAQAWLSDASPLACDALTVSTYLGVASLDVFFDVARASGRGVFVLAATSNEEGRVVQAATTRRDERVETMVLRSISEINNRADGLGSVGAVWGANRDAPAFDVTTLGGPFLVPGVGAQGAAPDHVARLFERCPRGSILVNVSREILNRGPERAGLRDAAQRWRDDLVHAIL